MGVRKIVHIDEEKCTGCGRCIIDCHEMALQIVDGKAKIVKDIYCDGLGDCLKSCPEDAITIIEREAEDYNDEAVKVRIKEHNEKKQGLNKKPIGGCPSSRNMALNENDTNLTQWPVQLKLLNPEAPYFKNADLFKCKGERIYWRYCFIYCRRLFDRMLHDVLDSFLFIIGDDHFSSDLTYRNADFSYDRKYHRYHDFFTNESFFMEHSHDDHLFFYTYDFQL